ncbi:MAG TPA: hypothetical protein VGK59_20800 [Ohtaekwangia sp.]
MSFIGSIFNLLRFNRKNWKAVALCIFAATIFWFFNALNKNYTTNITFPLAFDYNSENYVAIRPLPEEVRINVTGMGWDLFRKSLGLKIPPLVIPLERPSQINKIVGSTLPALFANQLERLEINFVLTDTLHISLEPKATRWVTLALDSPSILFKKGYSRISEATITPDSIYIEGPWNLIKSISEPVYLKIDQRNIDDDFDEDVEVKFLNKEFIRRDPPTVSVGFKVDPVSEVKDSIKIEIINAPRGARPSLRMKEWYGTFAIPKQFMSAYHKDSVRALIDLRGFSRGTVKVFPDVKGLPPYSDILKGDSVVIKY